MLKNPREQGGAGLACQVTSHGCKPDTTNSRSALALGASDPRRAQRSALPDGRKPTIMLSANNYLNLTTHPKVVDAAVEATKTYGAGSGSVRAIAGTMDLHLEAEKEVAAFKRAEAALIYSAGYTANVG